MEGLRPDQVALLADHRFRAQDALGALLAEVEASRGLPDPDAPAFQALLRSEPAVQVSCAVALLAEEHDRIHSAAEAAEISDDPYGDAGLALEAALEAALRSGEVHWNPMLVMGAALHKLEARRLPFSASDVELMLDFGLEQSAFWRFPYTVAAAEPALAAEPGSPAVLAALERAAGRLDGHWRGAYDPDLRAARGRIRALLAANLPRGLLDLSIVADGDAWAEPARAVLAAHADRWEGVPEVLAHFAAARGSRPTKTWSRRLDELLDSHPDLPSLSRELLEIVLEIDVVPTPDLVFFPRRSREGQALLKAEPDVLVSAGVYAVELRCEYARSWREQKRGSVVWAGARVAVPAVLLRLLRPRRLPWTPADAELLLDLAAGIAVDALAFATAVAERVLREQPGDPRVYRALSEAGPALDSMGLHQGGEVGRLRQRLRALVAAGAPGGLLDLALLEDGDGWAPAAAAAAREHAARWDGTQQLLTHLAAARGTRPSARWVAEARRLLDSSPAAESFVHALLEPAAGLELAPANERIVCGAAWAAGLTPAEDAVPLLRDVAAACAGPARVVARAAVEGLVLVDTPDAKEALRGLLDDVTRVTIRERIAEAVEASATPRRRRSAATRALGTDVLDALAAHGFDDRKGRECFRHSLDRVEVVWARSEQGAPALDVGLAFAAARRGSLGRPKTYYCDLRGMARLADDVDVDAALARALAWFEHWSEPAAVIDFVLADAGAEDVEGFQTTGPRGADHPGANLLAGYLAVAAGRPQLVRPCLELAAEHYRRLLDLTDPRDEELAAFVDRLEADAAAGS